MTEIPIGLQPYTVLEDCRKNFKGTLKAAAEMGYRGVEFAWNYGGMSPEKLEAFLKKLGLTWIIREPPLVRSYPPERKLFAFRFRRAPLCVACPSTGSGLGP